MTLNELRYVVAVARERFAEAHHALGIVREDDLPGSEAPRAWRDYLNGASAHDLRRVLAHNRQDVATLARLLEHLAQAFARDAQQLFDSRAVGSTASAV